MRLIYLLFFIITTLLFASPPDANPNGYSGSNVENEENYDFQFGGNGGKSKKKGTFFILELDLGFDYPYSPLSDYYYMGLDSHIMFGAGFKLPGTPIRLYAISEFGFGNHKHSRNDIDRGVLNLKTFFFNYSFGFRVYYGFMVRHRVFTDFKAGKVHFSYRFHETGLPSDKTASEENTLLQWGIGYQYRYSYHFSFGAKMDFFFPLVDETPFYNFYSPSGYEEDIEWINFCISLVYHF